MEITNQYNPQTVSHPGFTLREKLKELKIGPKEFAIKTDKPEKTITAVLSGNSAITADMALLFETVLKIPAKFWLNRQAKYDEVQARNKRIQAITEAAEWTTKFPYPQMAKNAWVTPTKKKEEKTINLFNFFGVASHTAWEKYYIDSKAKIAARISLKNAKQPHALSAWIRKGEIIADKIDVPEYDKNKLKESLPEIIELSTVQPKAFFSQLSGILNQAGVKLVFVPFLPKAPIDGLACWYREHPLIQVSGRGKRNDKFWFTIFHEIGHILLHGKKEMFLENFDYSGNDMQKEQEADEFAKKWTFTEEQEEEFLENQITKENIIGYANKYNIHPAFIVGRLQHKSIIKFSMFNELTEILEF